MTDSSSSRDHDLTAPAYRRVGLILLAAAIALFLVGGGLDGIRRSGPEPGLAVGLPEPVEPEGELASPPTVFRWTPGGTDVVFAQITVTNDDLGRLWSSGPLETSEVTIPLEVYQGVGAGSVCYWQIREFSEGHPRAASRLSRFRFREDADGFGPGENPALSPILRD